MSNESTFVRLHCWTNSVRQFDPALAHLIFNLRDASNFDQTIRFMENMAVLYWIKIPSGCKQEFVCNRVLDLTAREMWRCCPIHCNPADKGLKDLSASKLKNIFFCGCKDHLCWSSQRNPGQQISVLSVWKLHVKCCMKLR